MTLVDRYLLRTFARFWCLSLGAFCGLYLLVEFVAKIDDFIEHHAPLHLFVPYFVGMLPLILAEVIPLAVLFGMFLTLTQFSRTHELTALRAGGISLARICRPLLAGILALSLLLLASGEFLSPWAARLADRTLQQRVKGKPEHSLRRNNLWLRRGDTFIHVLHAVPEEELLQGVTLFTIDDRFRLRSRTDAPRAIFQDGIWILQGARSLSFDLETDRPAVSSPPPTLSVALGMSPANFHSSDNARETMSISDLHRLADLLQRDGADPRQVRTDFHSRFATPFAALVMGFLAIPFGLQRSRSSGLGRGVALTIIIGLLFHLAQTFLQAFGYGGFLPPSVAAWAADLLFGILGFCLLLSLRE